MFDDLSARYPHTQLQASGAAVGLPAGQMGNSEVGHLTIGAGAIVKQHLTLIDEAAAGGGFARNEVLRDAFGETDRVHLVGLTSTGGVHSSFQHLTALIDLAAELSVPDLVLHCITDGRDTSPTSGAAFLERVQRHCEQAGGRIATVAGRFWMMDRDHRWDRVQRAYDLLVHGRGERHVGRATDAAREAYVRGETDEFIPPTTVSAEGRIRPDDSVVCFNFRPDRMRELVRALAEPGMTDIYRGGTAPVAHLTTMTSYEDDFPYPIAFPPVHPPDTLAAAVSRAGMTQLHVAETEKYAHVTYFLGGGHEEPVPGEQRRLVPSVRDVATYDLAPAMSADAIVEAFRAAFAGAAPAADGDQLRQSRHGRPHRRDPGGGPRGGGRRPMPRTGGGGDHVRGRGVCDHGRSRQRRADARRERAQHRPLDQPGATRGDGAGGGARALGRTVRRRADSAGAARDPETAWDDRKLVTPVARLVPASPRKSTDGRDGPGS